MQHNARQNKTRQKNRLKLKMISCHVMSCVVMCDLILYGAMWMKMDDKKGKGGKERMGGNGRKEGWTRGGR